ncbi:plasmid mobilization relaxosome protein MobC [Devosia sp.]|uniref:plasmid mobilization relaxosome protein MobC n=1 Tax=Devosia sp. TaxID=1871048 RepID=UPI0027329BB6|nr:plasmid mobilization relaxosome protein MobC [Devosia sp.]MDP2780955.1 plasmid mobilization relaxosome protein MobC [Devosia sp.]
MYKFLSKRKQDESPVKEIRTHQVKVMLNDDELRFLDDVRGGLNRAEVMRYMLQNKMPAPIPELNVIAWTELSRASANLNQLTHHLNAGGAFEVEQVKATLERFRAALIGAAK